MPTPSKPGWKTTEFWMILAAGVAVTLQGLLPAESAGAQITAAIVAGLAALGYTASRTWVKLTDD